MLDESRMVLLKNDHHENCESYNNIDTDNFLTSILIVNIIQNINLPRKLIKFRIFLSYTLILDVYLLILKK